VEIGAGWQIWVILGKSVIRIEGGLVQTKLDFCVPGGDLEEFS